MKIAIIDYGAGNLPSVERALAAWALETERVTTPEQIRRRQSDCSSRRRTLLRIRRRAFAKEISPRRCAPRSIRGVPVLGICLGLQAMFASSEEAPGELGLGSHSPSKCERCPPT